LIHQVIAAAMNGACRGTALPVRSRLREN